MPLHFPCSLYRRSWFHGSSICRVAASCGAVIALSVALDGADVGGSAIARAAEPAKSKVALPATPVANIKAATAKAPATRLKPGANPAAAGDADEAPYGIEKRVLWETSNVAGTPDPPLPYDTERVYSHVRFDNSLDMVLSPDQKRWFIIEDKGTIYSFPKDDPNGRMDLFMDIRRKDHRYLQPWQQRRLWSMVFHPKFAENGFVYVTYLDSLPGPTRTRLSRFKVDFNAPQEPPVCDVESEYIMCEWLAGIDHFGGCLKFGPDGYLYWPVGDGSPCCDSGLSGQDLSDFNSSVLRIDVDRNDKGKAYAVPADNPFVDRQGARPEIWAYGTRNIWKMSFDRKTGDLWAGDVGQDLWDWILLVEKGGNYGWSVVEGSHPFKPEQKPGPTPILKPVVEHEHSEARSITGGIVYRGKQRPELVGTYIYGDFETGKIWGLHYDTEKHKLVSHHELADTALKLVSFAEDEEGELYILDYAGTIHRLIPAPPKWPRPTSPACSARRGCLRRRPNISPPPV